MQPGDVGPPAAGDFEGVVMETVFEAVEQDLAEIARRDLALARSALAMTAKALAERIDNPGNSATSVSMCAKALVEVMEKLRELAPPGEKKGTLHAIRSGRALRLVDGQSKT